jgi:hypothetical protein
LVFSAVRKTITGMICSIFALLPCKNLKSAARLVNPLSKAIFAAKSPIL